MRKKILIFLPLIVLCILMFTMGKVEATFRSNDPTVKSEETITITVTSTESLQNYDLSLKSYTGLTYTGCSAENAAVNSSSGKISFATLGNGVTTLGTYTFKAPKVTATTKYTVEFDINGTTNKSTVTVNPIVTAPPPTTTTQTPVTPTPAPEPEKGTLSRVEINGIKVNEYLTLKNQDSATIYVKTSTGESATIYNNLTKKSYSVKSGKSVDIRIEEGTNNLTITLETGNSYTRKIYSQKEEEIKPNVIEEEPVPEETKVILKTLNVKGINLNEDGEEEKIDFLLTPEFSSEVYEYSLNVPEYITKLDIEAIGDKDDFIIEITGNEQLKEGKNIITIVVKSKDGEKSAIYKITAKKEVVAIAAYVEPVIEETPKTEANNKTKISKYAMIGTTSIVTLAGIIFAIIEYRYGKKNKLDFEDGDCIDEEEEEEIDENEEKEQGEITKRKKGKHF